MRGRVSHQLSFGDSFIDPSLYELDEELQKVDELLSNPELLEPFEELFDETLGRFGTPVEVYLRMIYLRSRWSLNNEEIGHEVRERLRWRYFCHLSLMDPVPDANTLLRVNQRLGEERIAKLNQYLIQSLVKTRSIQQRRICLDSTILEPHITRSKSGVLDYTLRDLFGKTSLTSKEEGRFRSSWIISGAFVACLVWSILMANVGWNNTLSDQHGFRQTQTAITSYYFMHGGPFLSYETPVLGRPWSIPFEFPLYQGIVALASALFNSPLNQTGRFISEIFFSLSLLTVWFLLAELHVRPIYRLVFLSLVLVSPEYVFWSRTFMIESTALFFSMAYLLCACRYARDRSLFALLLGGVFGVVGTLVKTTTMPGFVIVAGLFYASTLPKQTGGIRKNLSRNFIAFLFFVCLPVLATLVWTHYTDEVRSRNVIGILTTSTALTGWTFGSFSQRLSPNTWKVLFDQTIPDLLGGSVIFVLPLLGICFARHRLFPFLTCILGFLSTFLIFTNLHIVHNYYAYANGIFLIAASSWAVVGLLEQKNWTHIFGIAIFFVMIFVSVNGYYERYYRIQKNNASQLDNVAYTIKQMIRPEEIILVFGGEWSSELPYYSERRALMWPPWVPQDMDSPIMKEALSKLSDTRVGALVVCNTARADSHLIKRATAVLKFAGTPTYEDDVCSLYSPDGTDKKAEETPMSNTRTPTR